MLGAPLWTFDVASDAFAMKNAIRAPPTAKLCRAISRLRRTQGFARLRGGERAIAQPSRGSFRFARHAQAAAAYAEKNRILPLSTTMRLHFSDAADVSFSDSRLTTLTVMARGGVEQEWTIAGRPRRRWRLSRGEDGSAVRLSWRLRRRGFPISPSPCPWPSAARAFGQAEIDRRRSRKGAHDIEAHRQAGVRDGSRRQCGGARHHRALKAVDARSQAAR